MGKIKILKVTHTTNRYLTLFYKNNESLPSKNYQEQYEAIMYDSFFWADFIKVNLEEIDSYEVTEIIVNAETLQKTWAKEHSLTINNDEWQESIFYHQIDYYKPSIIFMLDFRPDVKKIKAKFPFVKKIISWDGVGIGDINFDKFKDVDLIATCTQEIASFYQSKGLETLVIPYAFESRILERIKLNKKKYNASFVGAIVPGYHQNRLATLSKISQYINVDFFISSLAEWRPWKWSQRDRFFHGQFREFFDLWRLGRKNKGGLYGLDMYQTLADSKLTFNIHIDRSQKDAGNMRLFEATGVGACLVTDWKDNLKEIFDVEREIVTFKTTQECISKVRWLLKNEHELEKIAIAGQKKVLEKYNYQKRTMVLHEAIQKLLA